jgi:hypothetical protein
VGFQTAFFCKWTAKIRTIIPFVPAPAVHSPPIKNSQIAMNVPALANANKLDYEYAERQHEKQKHPSAITKGCYAFPEN